MAEGAAVQERTGVTRPEDVKERGLYDVEAVRHIIGPEGKPFHRDTVYRIPESQLPRQRVGAGGGRTLFRGVDILRYLGFEVEG